MGHLNRSSAGTRRHGIERQLLLLVQPGGAVFRDTGLLDPLHELLSLHLAHGTCARGQRDGCEVWWQDERRPAHDQHADQRAVVVELAFDACNVRVLHARPRRDEHRGWVGAVQADDVARHLGGGVDAASRCQAMAPCQPRATFLDGEAPGG